MAKLKRVASSKELKGGLMYIDIRIDNEMLGPPKLQMDVVTIKGVPYKFAKSLNIKLRYFSERLGEFIESAWISLDGGEFGSGIFHGSSALFPFSNSNYSQLKKLVDNNDIDEYIKLLA